MDFNIVASGSADNGISFGGTMDVDESGVGDPELFISGAFGTVNFGDVGGLNDIAAGDVGFDGVGAESLTDAGIGSDDINWQYSVNGVSLGLGYDTTTDDMTYSVGFSFSGVDLTVAGAEFDNNDSDFRVKAATSFGPLSAAVLFTETETSGTTVNASAINVGYAVNDALSVAAAFAQSDAAGDPDSSGVGFTYNLGGGLSLAGAVGTTTADVDVADFGFKMAF
jgi:outer membrane protein OmpU